MGKKRNIERVERKENGAENDKGRTTEVERGSGRKR